MLRTYKATLHGNRLEWNDATPPTDDEQPRAVHVTILETETAPTQTLAGQRMAAILEELAQHAPFETISDPVAWQQEQRGERVLPDRDADAD